MSRSRFPSRLLSDSIGTPDNFKVDLLPYTLGFSILLPSVTDLQATAFRILALILILELRKSAYRCPFHDCICSSGYRIEFDRKHGRTHKVPQFSGFEFCLPAYLVSLDLLIVNYFTA